MQVTAENENPGTRNSKMSDHRGNLKENGQNGSLMALQDGEGDTRDEQKSSVASPSSQPSSLPPLLSTFPLLAVPERESHMTY